MGTAKFLSYVTLLTFIHHFTLFFLEAFRWNEVFSIVGRTLLSTVFTVVLIYIVALLFNRRKE